MNAIHHVTAMSGKATRNLDFYSRVLGMRFVKKTVNFDDPGTYHFYFGDGSGNPGSIVTFFPWERATQGVRGVGEIEETWLRIPQSALGFWAHRFIELGVQHESITEQFGRKVLRFEDPDGMKFALVTTPGAETEEAWEVSGIEARNAIRGVDSVTLTVQDSGPTASILTDVFGFNLAGSEGGIERYTVSEGSGVGEAVQLHPVGTAEAGRLGRGSVHHVAFRAKSDAEQAELVEKLSKQFGIQTTPQKDRDYFRSVYFREPGGVLFEIATDDPGFAVDEPFEDLGTSLKLPKFLEPRRAAIEGMLPALG